MIFAKIDPVASVVRQNGPFNSTTVTGSYMTAAARPYTLGADEVNFQVSYGEVVLDASGSVVDFKQITDSQVTLNSVDLANWGTDDAVALRAIAQANDVTVQAIVSGSIGDRARNRF